MLFAISVSLKTTVIIRMIKTMLLLEETLKKAQHQIAPKKRRKTNAAPHFFQEFNNRNKTPKELRDDYENTSDKNWLTRLSLDGEQREFLVDFRTTRAIWHPSMDSNETENAPQYLSSYWEGGEEGAHFLQMRIGHGLLTAVSDIKYMGATMPLDDLTMRRPCYR